jgi:hypothetical protein
VLYSGFSVAFVFGAGFGAAAAGGLGEGFAFTFAGFDSAFFAVSVLVSAGFFFIYSESFSK